MKSLCGYLLILLVCSAEVSAGQQMDCTPLDPRQTISASTSAKVEGSVDTLYKIVKAGGQVETNLKREAKNLGDNVVPSESTIAVQRLLYLLCEQMRTSTELSETRKLEITMELYKLHVSQQVIPGQITNGQTPPSVTPDTPKEVKLNWGNLSNYFQIEKPNFQKGFQYADSKLEFIVEAKGDFSGEMQAYFYDSDDIKICFVPMMANCLSYAHPVLLSKNATYIGDSGFSIWSKGERDRVLLFIPHNASKIEINFSQSKF
ncbi:MAG: hypothetical protein U1F76_26290 [Candidatus Competibacteraceae bacterium]